MAAVSLINLTPAELNSILTDHKKWLGDHALTFHGEENALPELAAQSLEFMNSIGGEPRYFGYLGFDSETKEIVGMCGFKGAPNALRELEILFFVFSQYERRGYGAALAAAIVRTAREWTHVFYLTAHTAAEDSPATSILAKLGMQRIGEIEDPEDGLLWRWTMLN